MIKILGVSKSFGDKKILNNINLKINQDEITFIVGSSGAGKSTLLNIIGGLDTLSSGCIYFGKKDIASDLTRYRAENVGFIFQDYNLVSGLSVRKNIELGLLYSNESEKISEIGEQINKLGIKDKNQSIETLSGGEKQRVAIIRSICKESNIILADEPTGNLDFENAKIVFESLVKMKYGKHIVVVSHNLDMAHKFGDRIITISDGEIIDDFRPKETINQEIINEPISKNSRRKQAVNWKSVIILGCNSLKIRFSKIFSISLVISLAISALAIVYDFNNIGNSLSKNVNVNYLENDLTSIFYSYTANMGYKETPFSGADIDYVRNTYKTQEIVPIYKESDTWFFSNQNQTNVAVIKQININEFFKERIMSYNIEGEFLKNEDEIILASDVAKALFGDSCIGKEIALNDGSGESIIFKIVGINTTINPFDKMYSIVSSKKIEELLEKELTSELNKRLELNEFKEEKTNSESITVRTGGIYGSMKEIQGTEDLLYGYQPGKENEIMISSALLPHALKGFNLQLGYSESDIITESLSENVIKELTSKKIVLNHNGLFKLYIVGVYKSDKIEMRFQKPLITDLQMIEPTVLEAYLPQTINVSGVKEEINNKEKFICLLQLENLKANISMQTSFFKWVIILVGLIMILVAFSMLSSFSKIAVLERKKEVAIIKSLGATDLEVLFTLWFDAIAISFMAFLLSLPIAGLFVNTLPFVLKEMSFINFNYPLTSLIIVWICFMAFVCLYTFISLQKLVKKMPAELFRQ